MINVEEHLVDLPCDLCGRRKEQLIYVKPGVLTGFPFRLVRCQSCGLRYLNPRLSPDSVRQLYDHDYYAGMGFDDRVLYIDDDDNRRNAAIDAMNVIDELCPLGSTFLDYGCGLGELVAVAGERGWTAAGFEVSEFAAGYARDRGLTIFGRSTDIPESSFDVVVAIEVLEHCHSPLEALETMYRALRPGGTMYYTTANFDGYRGDNLVRRRPWRWRSLDDYVKPEGHIHFFSSSVMRRYCGRVGFDTTADFTSMRYPRRSRLVRALRMLRLADRSRDEPSTQVQRLVYRMALVVRAVARGRYLPVARK